MTDYPRCRECKIDHTRYIDPNGLRSVLENMVIYGTAIRPNPYCSDECRDAAEVRRALRPLNPPTYENKLVGHVQRGPVGKSVSIGSLDEWKDTYTPAVKVKP